MRPLIERGHIYVARPPLFKVEHKKNVRYVQSLEEMARELLDRGIAGSKLMVDPSDNATGAPEVFEGERLKSLMMALDELEGALAILERRGLNVAAILGRIKDGKVPTFRFLLGKHEHWFFTSQEVDTFRAEKIKEGHHLLVADDESPAAPSNGVNGHHEVFSVLELHELKGVNRGLEKLRGFGLVPGDLIPAPRVAGRDPVQRFFLENEDRKQVLPHLRVLVAEVRKHGEKGIKIVRFKGLGEMDGQELWDTTLNPETRTLLRVNGEDAFKADEMFRILMGEKVEPRREFIQKHALEVKEIDYHGA